MLREWFEMLILEGPKYGYFPEPQKIVHANFVHEASSVFADLGVKVVTGQRFLGGFVGSATDRMLWLNEKVQTYGKAVEPMFCC
jgi:hypothetical protein